MDQNTLNYLTSFIGEKISSSKGKGRKNKKPIIHYLENIFLILTTGMQWKHLRSSLHYTTYHKKYLSWSKKGFFTEAFNSLIQKIKSDGLLSKDDLKNLYIDSCMVKNVAGIDLTGRNHYDRWRKASKITLIVTDKGIPLSCSMVKANVHDTKEVIPSIDKIPIPLEQSYLIADKGYISQRNKVILMKKGIRLVVPKRKNERRTETKREKKLLKKRWISEHAFSWHQNYRRLKLRWDKLAFSYHNFYFLASITIIIKKMNLTFV